MSQGGQVTLTGYVVSEPKLRFVNNGTPVVNLRIGSTSRRIDRETGEWRDGDTSYFTVACWRTLATNVASCLRKGEPIVLRGKFRSSSYEDKEGRQHFSVDIEADTVGHDLSKGVAHFQRTRRPAIDLAALAEGEAIRSGVVATDGDAAAAAPPAQHPADAAAATDAASVQEAADAAGDMFDEEAVAELEREIDAAAPAPAGV